MRFQVNNLTSRVFRGIYKENYCIVRKYSNKQTYKVLFFGSDNIALTSLKKINEFRKSENIIERLHLVTANNSKHQSTIEKYAESEDILKLTWPLKNIKHSEYDIGLIVAFGHLITKDVLEKFPLGMVNVHPSLLPRWRGAAPIIHTLLHGDEVTGVSLMKIKPDKFDVGEIISQVPVSISRHIKLSELTDQLSELAADMLVKCMRTLPDCLDNAVPQSEHGITYAKKITKGISEVRWSEMSAEQVYNLYRAIDGIYTLTTKYRDKQIKLFDAFIDKSDNVNVNSPIAKKITKGISEVRWSEMSAEQVYNLYRAIDGIYTLTTKYRDKQIKLFDAFIDKSDNVNVNSPIGKLEYCDKRLAIKVLCKDRKYIYFKSIRVVGKRQISALDFYNGYIKNLPVDNRNHLLCY